MILKLEEAQVIDLVRARFFPVKWGTGPYQLTANIGVQVPMLSFSSTALCNCLADDRADSASVFVTMPVRS